VAHVNRITGWGNFGLGASFRQVKVSSLLTLDADHRAIGDSLVCLSVQRDTDRKAGRAIVPNDLNDCHAAGPLSNGFQALFSESSVAHPDCSKSRHLKHFLEAKRAPQPGVCGGPSPGEIGWGCHFLGRQAAKRRLVYALCDHDNRTLSVRLPTRERKSNLTGHDGKPCGGRERPGTLQPANPGLTSGLPRVREGLSRARGQVRTLFPFAGTLCGLANDIILY
jgi:hypothetical protein